MALGFGRKKHNGETEDETPLEAGVLDESFGLDEEHQAESGDEPSEFGDGSASEFRDEPATLEPPQQAPAETPRPRPVFLQGNGDGRDPKREERPEPPAPAPFSGCRASSRRCSGPGCRCVSGRCRGRGWGRACGWTDPRPLGTWYLTLLRSQRRDGIHATGAQRGHEARRERHGQ